MSFREWARSVLGREGGDRLADEYADALGRTLDSAIFHGTQDPEPEPEVGPDRWPIQLANAIRAARDFELSMAKLQETLDATAPGSLYRIQSMAERLARVTEEYCWPVTFWAGVPGDCQRRADALLRLPSGVMDKPESAPDRDQNPLRADGGITQHRETPLREGDPNPVVPQSLRTVLNENDSQVQGEHAVTTTHTHAGTDAPECTTCTSQRPAATPKDNRDAWLKLVAHLEAQLLSTREHAKAAAKLGQAFRQPPARDTARAYQATAWAAQRLLDAIQGLPVPEVPVDHTEGQASILDLVGGPAPMGPEETPAMPSTSGDELVEGIDYVKGLDPAVGDPERGIPPMSTPGDEPVEHRPRRLIDHEGDLWEEMEDGRWGFCPQGSGSSNEGPYTHGPGSIPWGPVNTLEHLSRNWGPLREPEGDEYDRGARDDE